MSARNVKYTRLFNASEFFTYVLRICRSCYVTAICLCVVKHAEEST